MIHKANVLICKNVFALLINPAHSCQIVNYLELSQGKTPVESVVIQTHSWRAFHTVCVCCITARTAKLIMYPVVWKLISVGMKLTGTNGASTVCH